MGSSFKPEDVLGKEGASFTKKASRGFGAGRTGGEPGRVGQSLIDEKKRQDAALKKPQEDAARDLARRNIIIARLRRAVFTGPGRAGTIATSPRGVTGITPLTRRTLQAA